MAERTLVRLAVNSQLLLARLWDMKVCSYEISSLTGNLEFHGAIRDKLIFGNHESLFRMIKQHKN